MEISQQVLLPVLHTCFLSDSLYLSFLSLTLSYHSLLPFHLLSCLLPSFSLASVHHLSPTCFFKFFILSFFLLLRAGGLGKNAEVGSGKAFWKWARVKCHTHPLVFNQLCEISTALLLFSSLPPSLSLSISLSPKLPSFSFRMRYIDSIVMS